MTLIINMQILTILIIYNRPQFKENPMTVKIPPSTKPGQNIIKVVATDADEGVNAEITYRFVSNNE